MRKTNKTQLIFLLIITIVSISCTKPDDAFLASALKNDLNGVKKAIARGANVNIRINVGEYKGFTVLMLAAKNGNIELVKMLLNAGADIDLKKIPFNKQLFTIYYGWTALHFAAIRHLEIVKLLIKAGANVNSEDINNESVLASALKIKNFSIVKELLKNGANVNSDNGLPLKIASSKGDINCIKLLIKHGADVRKYGSLALVGATVSSKNIDIVRLLLDNGADVNGGSVFNQIANPGPVIMRIIDSGDLDSTKMKILQLLVAYGANINAVKKGDETLLMVAVQKRNIELIKYLLQKGAEVNKTDAWGATALDYITTSEDNNKKAEIIQILKTAGARKGSGQPHRIGG